QTIKHDPTFLTTADKIVSVSTVMSIRGDLATPLVEELHRVGGVDVTVFLPPLFSTTQDYLAWAFWPSIPSVVDLNGSEAGVFRHSGSTNTTTVNDLWVQLEYLPANKSRTQVVLIL